MTALDRRRCEAPVGIARLDAEQVAELLATIDG